VWIIDYQLLLLPGLLRKPFPAMRVGFFLHTPFPSSEVFRAVPVRAEILNGMLGAGAFFYFLSKTKTKNREREREKRKK
jgi:trehalose-6-phosphate synthase